MEKVLSDEELQALQVTCPKCGLIFRVEDQICLVENWKPKIKMACPNQTCDGTMIQTGWNMDERQDRFVCVKCKTQVEIQKGENYSYGDEENVVSA